MGAFSNGYAALFSKRPLRRVNDKLLSLSLRAHGYGNFHDDEESGERFFIERILAPSAPELCLDIGANVGRCATRLLEATGARVVAFEPLPDAFAALQARLAPYGDRARAENQGVGAAEGRLPILFNRDAPTHASFAEEANEVPYVRNTERLEVPVTTLDAWCAAQGVERIDFVKIDTEGFEAEVFEGASRTFSVLRPRFIQIEFNRHHLHRGHSMHAFARRLPGYALHQLLPGGWAPRDPAAALSNVFEFSNFVFVRED